MSAASDRESVATTGRIATLESASAASGMPTQNSAIVETPDCSNHEIEATEIPPLAVAPPPHSSASGGHACGNGGESNNGVITMGMGDGGNNQSTPLNALSFNGGLGGNHLYCCRMYQETAGFYHDYSCVQSTLNLETRPNMGNTLPFSPFMGGGSRALSNSQFSLLGSFMHKMEKSVQTDFIRSYKDEFLRSLAEIEGLKMKISTLSKELRGFKDGTVMESTSHKVCEENLGKLRRALQSREIAVLERDFSCYEYQEQEKVYKRRMCDLEVGIVLGRQNYALKSISCEQVQADNAVKTFAMIMEKRPPSMEEFVKKFEDSQTQWTKLAAELSSLSKETLKFYTNQLRALQENNAQLLELPVLPNISVTTEKGRDPIVCLGEFLDNLISQIPKSNGTSVVASANSQSKDEASPSNSLLPSNPANVCTNVWNRSEKPLLAPGAATGSILCHGKHQHRIPAGLLVPPGFSHADVATTSHHIHHATLPLGFCTAGGGGGSSANKSIQSIFTTASGTACHNITRHKLLSSLFSDQTVATTSTGDLSHVASHIKHAHRPVSSPQTGTGIQSNSSTDKESILNPVVGSESHRSKQQCMCGVCGEPICKILSTRASCNHVFHPKCAIMIDKCPICLK
ncbi:uncharacterized protein LOC142350351 isoform X2 [Convolutriloba macropyga]|uniref:uncharacterized protein LOC142350351 isoform X2 n=1 Tax=Convolutriloba macropyga TaxID=536237 RepID=UPI003F525436